MSEDRFLVTGALGCLGAWAVRRLLDQGSSVVGLDRSTDRSRLRLLVHEDEFEDVTLVKADLTKPGFVTELIEREDVTHVIHFAALQIPFVRADPAVGASVNVVGTVNVFEGVRAHRARIRGFAYASSAAVFGPPSRYPGGLVRDDSPLYPDGSLYAVYKQANEATARVYANDWEVDSLGLRPFVVFGPGRDQGMTSGPTNAVVAALTATPYRITFGGPIYLNFAKDAADVFVAAARNTPAGATVWNVPGITTTVEAIVKLVESCIPGAAGAIDVSAEPLFAPAEVDSGGAVSLPDVGPLTPLPQAVERTVEILRSGLDRGLISPPRPPIS